MNSEKGSQVCVRLTRPERLLMKRMFELVPTFREQLRPESSRTIEVWMTVDEAEALREQAGDLFQEMGLGPDDGPSPDGRLLDALIDRLYRG